LQKYTSRLDYQQIYSLSIRFDVKNLIFVETDKLHTTGDFRIDILKNVCFHISSLD
jgi:hypothetical protein